MKIKHVITTLALAGMLGAGAFAGIKASEHVKEAKATMTQTSEWYLAGSATSWETNQYQLFIDSDHPENLGVLMNRTMSAGETFKFKKASTWDGALNFGDFNTGAGAYNSFCWATSDYNVYCAVSGTYNFFIYKDGDNTKVSVEYSDSNTATYSYVMTVDSGIGYTHLYNDTLSLRDWANAPAVNGQAYDIKFTYSAYDYYGIYRIDDRVLSGWDTMIMKSADGNKKSADINRTSGNKQELYICGNTVTTKSSSSDEYKAVQFLYDLVSHRGAAEYDSFNFAYSICATSPADAYELVNRYDGFASGVTTILSSASLRTYDVSGETYSEDTKDYAQVADMVDALRPIAAKHNPSGANELRSVNDSYTPVVVIIISSIAVVSILGTALVIKRRKTDR